MVDILVHKAVEQEKLTKVGKAAYASLMQRRDDQLYFPKLDGVYCQMVFTDDSWVAFSRTGEVLRSVDWPILDTFRMWADPARHYIGELWRRGVAHSVLNGEARKQTPVPVQQLHLFDSFDPERPYETFLERYIAAERMVHAKIPAVQMVHRQVVYSQGEVTDLARFYQANPTSAYDGLILRDAQAAFKPGDGRDGGNYKIKPRPSGDFRVIGTTEGKGRHAGRIGALIVSLGGDYTTEVGSGLTDADRERTDWAGAIVEVEYLSLTRDGKLREPSFKSRRWDKTEADVLPHTKQGTD